MTGQGGAQRRTTTAEWLVFAVASAIIAAVVGVLVVSGITGGSGAPAFDTSQRRLQVVAGRHQLAVTVKNVGDQAAADVKVAAAVPGEAPTEQTIAFLAAGEQQQVAFVFSEDPTETGVSVTVDAYREP